MENPFKKNGAEEATKMNVVGQNGQMKMMMICAAARDSARAQGVGPGQYPTELRLRKPPFLRSI